jgi:hypothetical protein
MVKNYKESNKIDIFSSLPAELILKILSFTKSSEIIEYCKTNRRNNIIYKNNNNLLSKYALHNDYGFNNFSNKYDYSSIISYLKNIWPMLSTEPILFNYNKMLERITHFNSIGIDIDVLRFLVANGADNYKDCIKSCVKFNNYTVFSYFVQEVSFDITYHGDYFLALCDIAFTNPNIYEDKRILEYLIKNSRQHLTRGYLEWLYETLLEYGSVPMADYVQLLIDNNYTETVSEFLQNYRD